MAAEQEYRPRGEGGGALESAAPSSREVDMTIRGIDDSQLAGAPLTVAEEFVAGRGADACMVDVEVRSCDVGVTTVLTSSPAGAVTGKRKRGRPPRGQPRPAPALFQQRQKEKEEDVCFICFDGGSLVLCDRRGCPKAYHPSCIKRDEAFFRSKAKWNCGWHICSTCQKASYYMCYTCTYSLCKGCTKNADYVCVRGNKGFCGTCMRTVMLIENIGLASKEMVQVDFDDKTSWEYLFKVYWVCLKSELSLSSDELIKAQNPWKGDDLPKSRNLWNGAYPITTKGMPVGELHRSNHEKGSKVNNHMLLVNKENTLSTENSIVDKSAILPPQGMAWATKELLEFVAHMKNGDVSVLSQFDVQALLSDYIKRNNLQDPRQKSQIICDSRLMTLFGKARLGHLEMLKLLEYHFLLKEKSNIEETVRGGAGDAVSSGLLLAESSDSQVIMSSERRRKPRRKIQEGELQTNPNCDEFAAIDMHNINLLYLKRSLVENLLDDADKFPENVIGSFVRIKISGGDQKFDAYRLVRVVGTSRAAERYTVSSRTTDLMLEILNLDNKEIVSIDGISNQAFSEDECRRLRQSIKCGLIKPLTVGEILAKAMLLQAVKASDVLEAEILRPNYLRDRAIEKGQQKQHREYIEKLEILKSPKERQRRLLEIPKVHADPKMDPSYESEEDKAKDEKKQGARGRPRNSGRSRKAVHSSVMLRGGNMLNEKGNRAQNRQAVVQPETCLQVVSGLLASTQNRQVVAQSETCSRISPANLPSSLPKGGEAFANDAETENLWHYQDPTGKVQGPFSMMQLRKWSSNGLLPLDLRVWRSYEQQNDSILLTDALVGRFSKEPSVSQEVLSSSTNNDPRWESGLNLNQSTDTASADSKNVESNCKSGREKSSRELLSTIFGSDSPSWTTSVTVAPLENGQAQSSLQGLDVSKSSKSWTDEPQICSKNASPPSSGKFCETPSPQGSKDDDDVKLNLDLSHMKNNIIPTEGQSNVIEPEEKRAESEVYSSHSPGQNGGPLPINSSSSSRWASNSGITTQKNIEELKQNQEIDFSDLPSTATEHGKEGSKGQLAENTPIASSNVPVLDSGPSWSTASSLVVGGQLPDVGGEWCGYSAPAKPAVDEWDSNVVPASSLKPAEAAIDRAATPTSGTVQLAQCTETHISIDADAWQPIVTEGPETEFSLVDESVSDLLAEVEAMESLGGMPSPTSRMTCAGELTHGSEHDCFTPVEEFSPLPDQGKNDALSSTGNLQLSSHLAGAHEPPPPLSGVQPAASEAPAVSQVPSQLEVAHEPLQTDADAFDPHKSFSSQSSNNVKVERVSKPVGVSQWQAGSDVQPPASSSHFSQGKSSSDSRRSQPDAYLGSIKGNTNLNRVPPAKDNSGMWGTGHGAVQHQGSMGTASTPGNPGSWGSHPRYGGDRSSGTRDNRSYYQGSRESGFVRDRSSSWNRQPILGVGNGAHSFRPSPKGQRVCKYYESGYCRKGASCSYWHPGP